MSVWGSLSVQVWGWLIAAVILMVVEAATVSLTSIWLAAGSLAAALTAMITDRFLIQLLVFVIVSLVLLIVTRPLANRWINRRTVPTNVDALIGQSAVVLQDVHRMEYGEVKVNGQIWTAALSPESEEVSAGEVVIIKAVEGVRLIVGKEL